jgi:UDP-glucose 4-epimerase
MTGSSSFTGYWFVREMVGAGHQVTATFRRQPGEYVAIRAARVQALMEYCDCVFGCSFGDEGFVRLISARGPWEVFCHHAAQVDDYRSPDFDALAALANNARNLRLVLARLQATGCSRVVLTGSVFEAGEGAGTDGLPAFSPYAVSKTLTADVFRYYTGVVGLRLGKFVVPNPFGPYEEPRFTSYLARAWLAGEAATVKKPQYLRDNIHASLLARAYVSFVGQLEGDPGFARFSPSGYRETQGVFAQRFAAELRSRLNLPCALVLQPQTEFEEPRARVNTDVLDTAALGWNETQAWDELAEYYLRRPWDGSRSGCRT